MKRSRLIAGARTGIRGMGRLRVCIPGRSCFQRLMSARKPRRRGEVGYQPTYEPLKSTQVVGCGGRNRTKTVVFRFFWIISPSYSSIIFQC